MKNVIGITLVLLGCTSFPAFAKEHFSIKEVPAAYLLKSHEVTVDAQGIKTERITRQLKILQDDGMARFGDIKVPYNAHYQTAKLIRAETVTPDGKRVPVQADLVKDLLPEDARGYREYSDLRNLSFSMPALTRDAIIEYEVELQGKEPIIANHFWTQYYLDDIIPVYTSRYTITTPTDIPYQIHATNMEDISSTITTNDDTTATQTWVLENIPRLKIERHMPPANEIRKHIMTTSLQEWSEVENWFQSLMQDRISTNQPISKRAQERTEKRTTRLDKINALLHFTQRDVRYVAIELGQGAYQPRSAEACLKNLYGDCKDKSVLLISLLKAIGIDAHIALVRPNFFGSVNQAIPHPGQFNHAIVYVPAPDKEGHALWLDPTVPGLDATTHPSQLDGCHAFVMEQPARFRTIPALGPERGLFERRFDVFVSPDGLHRVVCREIGHGRVAAVQRTTFSSIPEEERTERIEEQASSRPGFQRLLDWEIGDLETLKDTFEYRVEYLSNSILVPHASGFATKLDPQGVAKHLILRDWDSEKDGRKSPWIIHSSSAEALDLRIHLPPAYTPTRDVLPYDKTFPHGRLQLSSSYQKDGTNNLFIARFQADSLRSSIKPSRYDLTKRSVERSLQSANRTVEFGNEITNLLSRRQPAEARKLLDKLLTTHPDDAQLHHQHGLLLADLGYRHSAEVAIRKAITADPTVVSFYESLARLGHRYQAEDDSQNQRHKSLEIFNMAEGKVADNKRLRIAIAVAHATNKQGRLGGPSADLKTAIEIAEELIDEDSEDPRVLNLRATLAYHQGAYDEAIDFYLEAAEHGSSNPEMMQGLWRSEAVTGNPEAAINRLNAVITDSSRQISELNYLLRFLTLHDKHAEAAFVAGEIATKLRRPEIAPMLLEELKPIRDGKPIDYASFDKLDTPHHAMMSFLAAREYGDADRFERAISPDARLSCSKMNRYLNQERSSNEDRKLADSQITIALQPNNLSELKINDDLVRLKIQTQANELRRSSPPIEFLLKKYGKDWRVIDLKTDTGNPPNLLPGVLHQAMIDEDQELQTALVDYIGENYIGSASNARRRDYRLLLNEPCNTPENQARALAASGLLNMGDLESANIAHEYFKELIKTEDKNSTINLLLAQSYSNRGETAREAEYLDHAVALKPDLEQLAVERTLTHLRTGNLTNAQNALDDLSAKFPASRAIDPIQRDLLQRQGKTKEALQLAHALAEDRTAPELTLNELLLHLDAGNTNFFTEMVAETAHHEPRANLHRMLTYAFMAQGDFDGARGQLETARLLGLNTTDLFMETARCLSLQGDHAEAARILADFEATHRCEEDISNPTGYVYHGRGEIKKALAAYTTALKYQSPINQVYLRLLKATCLLEAGKTKPAQKQLMLVKNNQHGSEAAAACAKFAAMLLGEKSTDEVRKELEQIEDHLLRKDHLTEFYYYAGIQALTQQKDPGAAKKFFEQGVAQNAPMHMEYFLTWMQLNKLK